MTQEVFKRVVSINSRLKALEDAKKQITATVKHRLSYLYKSCNGGYSLCPDWAMNPISDILDRHDAMIRQEIDEEIESLKKEIETL